MFRSSLHTTIVQEMVCRIRRSPFPCSTLPPETTSEHLVVEPPVEPPIAPRCQPQRRRDPSPHHRGMGSTEFLQDVVVLELECVMLYSLASEGGGASP